MTKATHLPMRALALGFGIVSSPLLAAQEFGPRQELTAAINGVSDTDVGDINGDGRLDLVLGTQHKIELFLGGPGSSFLPKETLLETENEIEFVHVADFDGDGDGDVLYHTINFDRLLWIENLGSGVFGPGVYLGVTNDFYSDLRTADLDGDGDLDIYAATLFPDEVFWIPNLGGGDFDSKQVIVGSEDIPTWVDAGDVDQDGDLDLVASLYGNGELALWENLGGGAFSPTQILVATVAADFVQLVDLNADGALDLLTLRQLPAGGTGSFFPGDGTGAFGAPTLINHQVPGVGEAGVADLDGDGLMDLVLGSSGTNPLVWLKNLSFGSLVVFGPPQEIAEQAQGLREFPVVDLDGNGTLDVVVASSLQDKLSWYANDGNGVFGPENEVTNAATGALDALTTDFDGDGDQDVISLSAGDRKLALYESLGAGAFDSQRSLALVPIYPISLGAGDLDGDGAPDLVVGSLVVSGTSSDPLTWYKNVGGGEVSPPITIPVDVLDVRSVDLADLDADGHLDVLVASEMSNTLLWIPNLAGSGFGAPQILSSDTPEATSIQGVDMDGDGDLDVLSTSRSFFSNERVVWRENLGDGTFGATIEVAMLSNARYAAVVDVDRNGQVDVIACGSSTSYFRNTGGGTYDSGDLVNPGFARDMDATDIDGDGDPDVLVVRNGQLVWHRRTAFGGWTQPKLLEDDLQVPGFAAFTDMDGDGDPDVLFAGGDAGTVQWYENLIDPSIGVPDCDPAVPNSTGVPGTLTGIGSPWVPNNALVLTANDLPPNQVGLFLASPNPGLVVGAGGSQGTLCLSAPIGRFREPGQVQSSGSGGTLSLPIDLTQVPSPTGLVSVLMGEQWHFQVWHRDLNPGPTSNFTSALVIAFQ